LTAFSLFFQAKEFLLAEYIIKATYGQGINIENKYGNTALTIACRMGSIKFVELLVQNSADVDKETSTGTTALIEAVKSATLDVVQYLIDAGVDVQYKTRKHLKSGYLMNISLICILNYHFHTHSVDD
jgi:ankyrin repeat protein